MENFWKNTINVLCPSQAWARSNINLFGVTVGRHVEDIFNKLKSRCKEFKFYSVALNESKDSTDTAEVTVFICGIDTNFTIAEEAASVVVLTGATQGTDLHLCLTQTLEKCDLDFSNIFAITTDGEEPMTGEKQGLTTLFKFDAKTSGNNTMMNFHCIIHQENLC